MRRRMTMGEFRAWLQSDAGYWTRTFWKGRRFDIKPCRCGIPGCKGWLLEAVAPQPSFLERPAERVEHQ